MRRLLDTIDLGESVAMWFGILLAFYMFRLAYKLLTGKDYQFKERK